MEMRTRVRGRWIIAAAQRLCDPVDRCAIADRELQAMLCDAGGRNSQRFGGEADDADPFCRESREKRPRARSSLTLREEAGRAKKPDQLHEAWTWETVSMRLSAP
jgi:hypothetical protein